MSKIKYAVNSPDGFGIHPSNEHDTPEKAWEEYDEWAKRYEAQGYYSSNQGRIPLDELKSRCSLHEWDEDDFCDDDTPDPEEKYWRDQATEGEMIQITVNTTNMDESSIIHDRLMTFVKESNHDEIIRRICLDVIDNEEYTSTYWSNEKAICEYLNVDKL